MADMNTDTMTVTIVPGEPVVEMARVFEAPRDLVYRALTNPAGIPQWWGPQGSTTRVDVMDVRVGGNWRFVEVSEDGSENGFRGEYREVVPGERVVQTFEWEGLPGHVLVETMTLQDAGPGRTLVTTRSVFANLEDRDGMVSSGMETGARESWDRLAEYIATL